MTRRDFSSAEDQFIIDHYGRISSREIARKLGRGWGSINGRVGRLGLYGSKVGSLPRVTCSLKHCRELDPFSHEWYIAQNKAFCAAMEANPDERPTDYDIPSDYRARLPRLSQPPSSGFASMSSLGDF